MGYDAGLDNLTEDMIRRLESKGLTHQQATSQSARAAVNALLSDDLAAVKEISSRGNEAINDLYKRGNNLLTKLEAYVNTLDGMNDFTITDDKIYNIVGLFLMLKNISLGDTVLKNTKDKPFSTSNVDGEAYAKIINSISYIVYAYANDAGTPLAREVKGE